MVGTLAALSVVQTEWSMVAEWVGNLAALRVGRWDAMTVAERAVAMVAPLELSRAD